MRNRYLTLRRRPPMRAPGGTTSDLELGVATALLLVVVLLATVVVPTIP